jgi:hypothetical protein
MRSAEGRQECGVPGAGVPAQPMHPERRGASDVILNPGGANRGGCRGREIILSASGGIPRCHPERKRGYPPKSS